MHIQTQPIRSAAFGALALMAIALSAGSAVAVSTYFAYTQQLQADLVMPPADIVLLQPLGAKTSFPPTPGIGMIFDYFNDVWPWVLGSSAGIAVFWALVGGIQVMMSGNKPAMREEGMQRLLWSLAGLLLVGLAGFILRTINPIFYI